MNRILSILPFESGPLVSLLLRITAVQTSLHGCSYRTGVCEFAQGRPAWNARITCLRYCDERTRVITCVIKSLVHALESCPSSEVTPRTCCSANLCTFSRENSKSASLVNAYIDSYKSDAILREPSSYYSYVSVPKWPQKQPQST